MTRGICEPMSAALRCQSKSPRDAALEKRETQMNETTRPQDGLREKLVETRHNISDMGHLAKEAVQDKLHDLKDRAAEKYGEGKEKLHELEEGLVRRVRNAPMQSVMIAAGIGLALGFLWRRS
jgi:ElaB/YqjD/DUF883 family membrane-anchored ribosome-binding protein